jgi:hypothetical protein
MQRHSQLDHAEPGAEMPACDSDSVDCFSPQLIGKLAQLALFKLPEIVWSLDKIKQRRLRRNGHANAPFY